MCCFRIESGAPATRDDAHSLIVTEELSIENMTASAKGTVEKPGKNVKAKAGLNPGLTLA